MIKEKIKELIRQQLMLTDYGADNDLLMVYFYQWFTILEDGSIIKDIKFKPITIYCLINPIDNSVFYVGRTCSPLEKRLQMHSACCEKHNLRKKSVVQSIKKRGLKVQIKELETFHPLCNEEYNGTHNKELCWILEFLNQNQPITNKIPDSLKSDVAYYKSITKDGATDVKYKWSINVFNNPAFSQYLSQSL